MLSDLLTQIRRLFSKVQDNAHKQPIVDTIKAVGKIDAELADQQKSSSVSASLGSGGGSSEPLERYLLLTDALVKTRIRGQKEAYQRSSVRFDNPYVGFALTILICGVLGVCFNNISSIPIRVATIGLDVLGGVAITITLLIFALQVSRKRALATSMAIEYASVEAGYELQRAKARLSMGKDEADQNAAIEALQRWLAQAFGDLLNLERNLPFLSRYAFTYRRTESFVRQKGQAINTSDAILALNVALQKYSPQGTALSQINILISFLGTISLGIAVWFAMATLGNIATPKEGASSADVAVLQQVNYVRGFVSVAALLIAASFAKYMVQLLRVGVNELHRHTDREQSINWGLIYLHSVNQDRQTWSDFQKAMEVDNSLSGNVIESLDPASIDLPLGQVIQQLSKRFGKK